MLASLDQVLQDIGGYGLYQCFVLQITGFTNFAMSSFHVSIITFIAGEPTWECISNSTICNITGAIGTTSDDYSARCSMPRSEWKFSDTFTSTVTEFELVCERSFIQNIASSVFWLGWLIGNLVFGHIADKIGRRKAIIISAACVCLLSWIIVWPPYLSVYILCRILTGIVCAGTSMTCFVLLVEYSGIKHRSWSGSAMWLYGSASNMLLSLMGYLVREWRNLMLFGAVMSLPVVLITWFLPESCRYLLVNHRADEAIKQLKKVARWNKKVMPEVELEIPKGIANEKSDIRDLFYDSKVARITIACWITWFCCALVYYTVTYGSIYLGGSVYLNFFLVTLVSCPSILTSILCMDRFGRRKSVVGGLAIAAVTSAIAVTIPSDRSNEGYMVGRIIMAMLCNYSIIVAFTTIYVYSSELFPTSIRNVGMGTSSACARIGSFLALYVVWLIRIHALLPYSIVAVLCLFTGFICFTCLPETVNKPTRETMAAMVISSDMTTNGDPKQGLLPENVKTKYIYVSNI